LTWIADNTMRRIKSTQIAMIAVICAMPLAGGHATLDATTTTAFEIDADGGDSLRLDLPGDRRTLLALVKEVTMDHGKKVTWNPR
jgi:hypothetical protein